MICGGRVPPQGERRALLLTADRGLPVEEPVVVPDFPGRTRLPPGEARLRRVLAPPRPSTRGPVLSYCAPSLRSRAPPGKSVRGAGRRSHSRPCRASPAPPSARSAAAPPLGGPYFRTVPPRCGAEQTARKVRARRWAEVAPSARELSGVGYVGFAPIAQTATSQPTSATAASTPAALARPGFARAEATPARMSVTSRTTAPPSAVI